MFLRSFIFYINCAVSLSVSLAAAGGAGAGREEYSVLGHSRSRRYLIYPDGGPARVQFIIGFGVPIDLEEQAVTAGIVIKLQYHIPTNSTEYTTRIFDATQLVSSRFMNKGGNRITESADIKSSSSNAAAVDGNEAKIVNEDTFDFNKTQFDEYPEISKQDNTTEEESGILVDINLDGDNDNLGTIKLEENVRVDARDKRSPLYMEGETNNKLKYQDVSENDSDLPLSEAIRLQEERDEAIKEGKLNTRMKSNRWDLYRIFESMIERHGFSGRACLLRTVCEAASAPFTHHNGLLGELLHILFTPSTTKDKLSHHTDNEFHAAEILGRDVGLDCGNYFPECETSILDMFTDVSQNALRKLL